MTTPVPAATPTAGGHSGSGGHLLRSLPTREGLAMETATSPPSSSKASPADEPPLPPPSAPGFLCVSAFPKLRHLLATAKNRGLNPGALFVDLVLERFYSPVCADLVPPSSPSAALASPVWISVTSASASPTPMVFVLDALGFWLGFGPDHIRLREIQPRILTSLVSSPSVAAFIVSLAGLRLGGVTFRFHPVLEDAIRFVQNLNPPASRPPLPSIMGHGPVPSSPSRSGDAFSPDQPSFSQNSSFPPGNDISSPTFDPPSP